MTIQNCKLNDQMDHKRNHLLEFVTNMFILITQLMTKLITYPTFGIKHCGGSVWYSDDEMFLLQDGQPNAGWQVEVQHGKFGHQTRRTKLFDVG